MTVEIELEPLGYPTEGQIVCVRSIYGLTPLFGTILTCNGATNKITVSFSCGYHVEEYDIENLFTLNPKHL